MKQRKSRVLAVAAVGAAALFTATACSSSSSSSTAASGTSSTGSAASLTSISFLTNYISTQEYTALVYGMSLGYFTDAGIKLDLTYGSGSSTTAAALGAGKADMGDIAASVLPISVGKGVPITGVGSLEGKNAYGFVVPKSSGITSVAGLKGKSVLVSTGTAQETLMPAVLKAAGLSSTAVSETTVAAPARVSSYKEGKGDATAEVLPSEVPIIGAARPSTAIAWAPYLPIPDTVFVANNSYLKSNASTVRKFLTAYYRSLAASFSNETAADAAYAKSEPLQDATANAAAWTSWKTYMCSTAQTSSNEVLGYPNTSDWTNLLKFSQSYEGVPASVTLSQIMTNEFFTGSNAVSTTSCSGF